MLGLEELHKNRKYGISLRFRLLTFLFLFVTTIILGFFIILILTGVFNMDEKESRKLIETELIDLRNEVYADFGKLSRQGIALSEQLSSNISKKLKDNNISSTDLHNHPELLETILDSQFDGLLLSLQGAKSSGIYIILDSTVNSEAKGSEFSRAGIFLKSTEPNIVNSIDVNIRYLKGPANIAREHNIELLPQWEQEFNIQIYDFYNTVIQNAKNTDLPLSRLYYWSNRLSCGGNGETGMLLAVPIIAEDGTVYGICGYEVSSMLFKLAYSPDNTIYPRIFTTMSMFHEDTININSGLIASNYYMTNLLTDKNISFINEKHSFICYLTDKRKKFRGLHKELSLYPSDSVYANNKWLIGILMPQEDLFNAIGTKKRDLFIAVNLLFASSLIAAIYISRKYINPIKDAFDGIKTKNYTRETKTKILEIDDLFEYLAHKDTKGNSTNYDIKLPEAQNTASYDRFVENIKTLSPAEKAVFDLYVKGHTAKEITEILYLSINTIKTHNRRIYDKLNVSSRKELLVYTNMMKDFGKIEQ